MEQQDASNIAFETATDFVMNTSRSVFLTGKAGTGKTSFLRTVRENSPKRKIVLAPTGVAAINAGGVTLHSFFQLPRGVFVPEAFHDRSAQHHLEINDPYSLIRNIRFSAPKREMLEELELMIIDEVSMVRTDMMDAIDLLLRHFRNNALPFGGVQVLLIGDLYQLPPVIPTSEWEILQSYYDSPFFFSSRVIKAGAPLYVELEKVYRQNEQVFIDILNRIREQQVTSADLQFLNQHYDPGFTPPGNDPYITITTHNKIADQLNQKALRELAGNAYDFPAVIEGEFIDRSYPADHVLYLKKGAQVMFIKNDTRPERRYYNGKIGKISALSSDEVRVKFEDGSEELIVEKETWKNIRYHYEREKNAIEEEELGSFSQYPLRLAWAITVHKSQGLTFQRAIIDVGASFAAGQVYVALSRCTSLSGLVLRSRIPSSAITTDQRIYSFAIENRQSFEALKPILDEEKDKYQLSVLSRLFDFKRIRRAFLKWNEFLQEREGVYQKDSIRLNRELRNLLETEQATGDKFQHQLHSLLQKALSENEFSLVTERIQKAIMFFGKEFTERFMWPIREHRKEIRLLSRTNKYVQLLTEMDGTIWDHVQSMVSARFYPLPPFVPADIFDEYNPAKAKQAAKSKPSSGSSSAHISLELFKEGRSIAEIAATRQLSVTTVESHLAGFAGSLIPPEQLISPSVLETILALIPKSPTAGASTLKAQLPDTVSYFEIRVALHFYRSQQVAR